MVTVRAAVEGDVEWARVIEVDAGRRFHEVGLGPVAEDDPPSADELAGHVRAGTMWVAELDGEVIGYAVASIVDDHGHLDQVSVTRMASGRGVGTALLDRVCAWASGVGSEWVTLTTFRDVPWNAPYYSRRGFSILDEAELGPELAAVREMERIGGLEVSPRVAMRRRLASADRAPTDEPSDRSPGGRTAAGSGPRQLRRRGAGEGGGDVTEAS